MAEAEFFQYLSIIDVVRYCDSINAEERQNIICEKLKQSLLCFKGEIYFFDQVRRVFKIVGEKKDGPLKSMIESFVRNSMLILARNPASNDPDENPENLAKLNEMAAYCRRKENKKAMEQLNNLRRMFRHSR